LHDKPLNKEDYYEVEIDRSNEREAIIDDQGNKLTTDYIWSKSGEEREKLVDWVFNYYKNKGFPYLQYEEDYILNEFKKVKLYDVNKMKYLSNNQNTGLDISKYFMQDLMYKTRVRNKKSIYECFYDDDKLLQVIKNRMGYYGKNKNNKIIPLVFSISDKMILRGLNSSGISGKCSIFKTINAKWIYNKYKCDVILDFSAGWGNRMVGALSLGKKYYGIDPLTYDRCNKMNEFFNGDAIVFNGCSENESVYENIPEIDLAFSSPPYYDLEVYSDDNSQSYNKFKDYNGWLIYYWEKTLKNCYDKLKNNGYFILNINNKYFKDMHNLNIKYFNFIEEIPIYTNISHFNVKVNKQKTKDNLYIYKKNH
jgi:hypothetical protein